MNVSAYILANKSQEVPVPEPGEEVTSGFSWTYSNPVVAYTMQNVDPGYGTIVGTWTTGTSQSNTQYQNWKNIEGAVPSDVGWHQDLYADKMEGSSTRYTSRDVEITNVTGSITLNISNLPAGKYVAIFDHWCGSRLSRYFPSQDPTRYMIDETAIQGMQSITQGTNGIVYGVVRGIEEYLAPNTSYSLGVLGGLHLEQRCEFTIADGDTTKTFTYGDSTFGVTNLCANRHRGLNKWDLIVSSFYSATTAIRARLYTEA